MSTETSLGARIRTLREQRRTDQAVVAEAVGTARSHLTNIEIGRAKPGRELLVALAQYFDVSLDWLTSGAGEPKKAEALNSNEALLLFGFRNLDEEEAEMFLKLILARTKKRDA